MNKENEPVKRIPGVGRLEQSQPSSRTARPENSRQTGPTEPNSEQVGYGEVPARGEEDETPGNMEP